MNSTADIVASDLHARLAEQYDKCRAYYNDVTDEYRRRIAAGESTQKAMRECFYIASRYETEGFIVSLGDTKPSAPERMLVRKLAKIPSV